jgi:DNA excision repair protein ERCC-4
LCAKPTNKHPAKKSTGPKDSDRAPPSVQSKLVLPTLHFPRVRIIWSSSPYGTADIFDDLKANAFEPGPNRAIAIGAEEDPEAGAGINAAAEELLRRLPGVTAKNVQHVMNKVGSVRKPCELDRKGVQGILGVEPGNACYYFMHRGDRKKLKGVV